MVGFGAGGGTDIAARIVAEPLGEALGQRIVIENKPGAGGTIAGDSSRRAQGRQQCADDRAGHTVAAAMIKSQPYDAVKDSPRSASSPIPPSPSTRKRIFRRTI